jgi:hypothetical protein
MNLSALTREQLEEIVKEMDEALRYIEIHSTEIWHDANVGCARITRAKVQRMIEEAEGE